jgi:hypothetical protein
MATSPAPEPFRSRRSPTADLAHTLPEERAFVDSQCLLVGARPPGHILVISHRKLQDAWSRSAESLRSDMPPPHQRSRPETARATTSSSAGSRSPLQVRAPRSPVVVSPCFRSVAAVAADTSVTRGGGGLYQFGRRYQLPGLVACTKRRLGNSVYSSIGKPPSVGK